MLRITIIFCVFLTVIGCSQKEEVDPLFESETIAEQQKRRASEGQFRGQGNPRPTEVKEDPSLFYVRGKYFIDPIEVNPAVDTPLIITDALLNTIVDIVVRIGGQFEVESDPIPVDVSEIPRDIVKEVYIKGINLKIADDDLGKDDANLKWIKRIKIEVEEDSDDGVKEVVVLRFDRKSDRARIITKACKYKCLELETFPLNLMNYINEQDQFVVKPSIKLGSTPQEEFKITGEIQFQIGLKLPF